MFKRFDYLHMRNLLEQQDQLSELESRLNECDDNESIQLFLSSRRQDRNQERRALMEEIRQRLATYGECQATSHFINWMERADQHALHLR